jgi:Peptidase S46
VYGRSQYPDANFTLRLSYGTVKGYPMNGTIAPSRTTFYGLYDRVHSFGNKDPFNTPQRFLDRVSKLDLTTPLNFVTTNDIIGGNSGSPLVNRNGEFVGIAFDGNIESLVGNFIYDDTANRTVAVHAAGIMEAMRKLYDAGALADEIEGKMAKSAKK